MGMNALIKVHTNISKTTPIYLYGNDWSGAVLTNMGVALLNAGWNVQGYLVSSPYADMDLLLKYSVNALYDKGNIWWTTFVWYKWLANVSRWLLSRRILGSHFMSVWA